MKTKRGMALTVYIIGVIVLVASVVAIFFLISQSNFKADIDKQACKQSIVLRSSANFGAIDASESIPLQCKTKKVCLSVSGNDCSDVSSTKDNKVEVIKISDCKKGSVFGGGSVIETKDCTETRKEIMDVFAEQMVRCHDMVGEGKLNFISKDAVSAKNYGLVCNRIVFDDELKNLNMEPISFLEFYSHLNKRKLGDKTDFEYLYPGINGVNDLIRGYQFILEQDDGTIIPPNPKDWQLKLDQPNGYGIMVNIAPNGQWASILGSTTAGAAVIGVGTLALFSGVGVPVGIMIIQSTIIGAGSTSGFLYWYLYDEGFAYSPPTVIPFTFDVLRDLDINDFEVAP